MANLFCNPYERLLSKWLNHRKKSNIVAHHNLQINAKGANLTPCSQTAEKPHGSRLCRQPCPWQGGLQQPLAFLLLGNKSARKFIITHYSRDFLSCLSSHFVGFGYHVLSECRIFRSTIPMFNIAFFLPYNHLCQLFIPSQVLTPARSEKRTNRLTVADRRWQGR